jgi:hypothetical protein
VSHDRVVALTDHELELAWRLTCAMASNEDASRRSLDQIFLQAARFVHRVEGGLASGGVELDTGKAEPGNQRVTWRVVRRG